MRNLEFVQRLLFKTNQTLSAETINKRTLKILVTGILLTHAKSRADV